MKYRVLLISIIVLTIAALILSEKRKVDAPVRPDPILYFVADAERELGRLPVAATRLPDREEIQIGDELARRFASFSSYSGQDQAGIKQVEPYLEQVGLRVAAHAHRKLPYRFHYVPNPDFINAFALPGGHVFVGAGLMALMDSEDELAAILGHEIEHIDHYHCAERVQLEARLRHLPLGELVELPIQLFEAGYSKDQELEADREGTRLAVWASYSPLGAIRMFWAFDRLYREYIVRARTPQEELTQVALETLTGYFRSHPPPAQRIEQINQMIADEHWGNLTSERPFEVSYVFWTERARRAFSAGHYQEAAALAKHSLEAHPEQPSLYAHPEPPLASEVLGMSEFALANFSEAAATYRNLLDIAPLSEAYLHAYADSLAARADPSRAVREFQTWLTDHPGRSALAVRRVELAGLMLVARDKVGAGAAIAQLNTVFGAAWPPELAGRLGWWNYRAGNYPAALNYLTRAAQQRPGDATFREELGWVHIEQRDFEDALSRFSAARGSAPLHAKRLSPEWRVEVEPWMGSAVAHWLARQKDEALNEFSIAADAQPEWLNPRWTRALCSPTVAKAVAEMQAEKKKHGTTARLPLDILLLVGAALVAALPAQNRPFATRW
jgi:predicted Zn-dependent protease